MIDRHIGASIAWRESEVNYAARRESASEAAEFLRSQYRAHAGVFTTFGYITRVFQRAGIPLRDTLTWDNSAYWHAAAVRPDLFLREEWAVAEGGDRVQSAIIRAELSGPRYTLLKKIVVKNAPVIEIYRFDGRHGLRNPMPEGRGSETQ
jgi:hypothetical protein